MTFDTAIPLLLKLKMNPRKRQKRSRSIPPPPPRSEPLPAPHQTCPPARPVTPPPSEHKEGIADNVLALLRQEESDAYSCVDYLSMTVWQHNMRQLLSDRLSKPLRSAAPPESRIDEYCREQICEWTYRVVDYFRIDREVVAVSMSYLDRFLCTCSCDRSLFKLAATTSLYMAVKIFHPQKLGDLGVLSDLSRGEFVMTDVSVMEEYMIRALAWRLHPPTGAAMTSLLLDYIFCEVDLSDVSSIDMDDIYDNSCFFAELAVCDYFFVSLRPSTIALASILNAVEGLFGQKTHVIEQVLQALQDISFPTDRQELSAACNRLWELYERSEECALHHETAVEEQQSAVKQDSIFTKKGCSMAMNSPVSVASMNEGYRQPGIKTFRNGSW